MASSPARIPQPAAPALTLVGGPCAEPATGAPVAPARLVRRLVATADVPLVLIVAPAGYGKTTLLRAWAAADPRPFVATARQAAAASGPCVIAVDDADGTDAAQLRALLALTDGALPAGSLVALTGRSRPALPIGRLRAQRRVDELGPRDLALTRGEAAALLRRAGARCDPGAVAALMARTEGWPAGLQLAAAALAEQPGDAAAAARFDGGDRVVADYLRGELLARLPAARVRFLRRASVLEPLSGPVCDAVLDRHDSAHLLCDLSRSELPLFALDRTEEHFRLHPLLADMLRAELRREEPVVERELHRRASAWSDEHGDLGTAIDHAIAADDLDRTAELLWRAVPTRVWDGRRAEVEAWLQRIGEHRVHRHPALALTAATAALAAGHGDAAHHWLAAAAGHVDTTTRSWRKRLQAGLVLVAAAVDLDPAPDWPGHVARAAEAEPPDSPWRTLACLLQGVAASLDGAGAEAPAALLEGARRGAVGAPALEALCEAQLALDAWLRGDLDEGAERAERARARAAGLGRPDALTGALTHAAAAVTRAQRGRLDEAAQDVRRAHEDLAALDGFAPWYDAQVRLALAGAQLRLSDVPAARTLLQQASRSAARLPGAGLLRRRIDELWARLDTFAAEALRGPSALTMAELRVLRFLPSHLSFREIAERLNVSANTVKTQAHAVYRKLDASSRSAAVARARHFGLLDP